MKKVLLSAVALCLAATGFAQTGFGIKAGVNLPKYNFSGGNTAIETKNSTNFYLTAYADAPIVGNFLSVQPGISLQGKGSRASGLFTTVEAIDNALDKATQNTMWVEVPVNLVAKLPIGQSGNIFVGAGPYAAVGISGQNKYDGKEVGDFKFGKNESQKGFDYGVNLTAGFQLSSGFLINAGYGLGLADIAPENNTNIKQTNRVFSIGVGFAL